MTTSATALPRHLVVATDFGPSADNALARALALAQGLGARLSLLHVVEPLPIVSAWGDAGSGGSYTTSSASGLPVSGAKSDGSFSFNTAAAAADQQGSNSTYGVAWARWSSNWSATESGSNVSAAGWMHASVNRANGIRRRCIDGRPRQWRA